MWPPRQSDGTAIISGSIAVIAGMIVRSLFIPQRPPQSISVHAAPAERSGGGGDCLPRILVGAVLLLVLAAAGASVARVRIVRRSLRLVGAVVAHDGRNVSILRKRGAPSRSVRPWAWSG